MGRAILPGIAEVLGRLNVLAGRRLVYFADVRRQASGHWLIERHELAGEGPTVLRSAIERGAQLRFRYRAIGSKPGTRSATAAKTPPSPRVAARPFR